MIRLIYKWRYPIAFIVFCLYVGSGIVASKKVYGDFEIVRIR